MQQVVIGMKPMDVDGLAVYDYGDGDAVLLMPYSHSFTTSSMAEGRLANLLAANHRLITFDPPGAYRSTRRPRMDVAEMIDCAVEALGAMELDGPVDVVGHSAGAFCATAFAATNPERVNRLALVAPAGVGDPSKLTALPFGPTDRRFWRFYRNAIPVYLGMGNAEQHKAVYDVLVPALHADPAKCPEFVADPRGRHAPAPRRATILRGVPELGPDALAAIRVPTLLVAGSRDPIVPLSLAEKVAAWIPQADLVVFEDCGHYPQHEAPEQLHDVLAGFLNWRVTRCTP